MVATAVAVAVIPKNRNDTVQALSEITDWGLSFSNGKNKVPRGNVSQKELDKYGAFYCDDRDEKVIYLTFDAGYENGNAGKILDVLKKSRFPPHFSLLATISKHSPNLCAEWLKRGIS